MKLEKILLIILGAVGAIILLGTVIAFASGKASLASGMRHTDPSPEQIIQKSRKKKLEVDAFTKIGELRAGVKAEDGIFCSVSLRVWFSYPAGDTVFYEELCQKERSIRSIILEYFASHTKKELLSLGEQQIKDELRTQINETLILGKIINVYFDEYLFLG